MEASFLFKKLIYVESVFFLIMSVKVFGVV